MSFKFQQKPYENPTKPGDIVLELSNTTASFQNNHSCGKSRPWVVMLLRKNRTQLLLFDESTAQLKWVSSLHCRQTNARVDPARFKHAVYSDGTKVAPWDTTAYSDHNPIFDIANILGLNRIAVRNLNRPSSILIEDSTRMRLCW